MDLLYAQFNVGRLSLAQIKTVLGVDFGNTWPLLQEKFKKDDNGNFFNERAEQEADKRRKFTESRRKNLKSSHMAPHMETHMENENVDSFRKGGLEGNLKESNLFRQPKIPTQQQVFETFINHGGTKEMATAFWNKHSGTGWFSNGSPIVSYSSFVSNFIMNWKKNHVDKPPEPDQSYRLKNLDND